MVEALRRAEAETPEPICYIISGDLAHIGPKFGDPIGRCTSPSGWSKAGPRITRSCGRRRRPIPAGYFEVIADERDSRAFAACRRRYTVLEAIRPGSGKLLHYDQYAHPRGHESVSFASMAFYGTAR